MSSEEELIQYLASIGFKGEGLQRDLVEQLGLNADKFTIQHRINHGEEIMFFDLDFEKDHQFNAYRLVKYYATHRAAVIIEHKEINGIDTAVLEEQMKGYDWTAYFKTGLNPASREERAFIEDTSHLLEQMAKGEDPDEIRIQELLRFKYWPKEINERSGFNQNLESLYERSREFVAANSGICNAHLAYYHVSGKFNDLYQTLNQTGLEKYAKLNLHTLLEQSISSDPKHFTIHCASNDPEAYASYELPVLKTEQGYESKQYSISITPYPPIQHGVYNGIDSASLERDLLEIDWNYRQFLFIIPSEPEYGLLKYVDEALKKLELLGQHETGAGIAQLLQLKLFQRVGYFDAFIKPEAYALLQSLPKITGTFPLRIDGSIARNLLCGRAVWEHVITRSHPQSNNWLRFNADADINLRTHPGTSKEELRGLVGLLPLDTGNYNKIVDKLQRGDLFPVPLKTKKVVLIESNPEQKTINVYTRQKQSITVNISFDPNWKGQGHTLKQLENRPIQKPLFRRRRGGSRL